MINSITSTLERKAPTIRRLGRKVFDIKEIDAQAYLRKSGNIDVLTVLDKDYNKLLVQNVRAVNAREQESVTKINTGIGKPFTIRTIMRKVEN